MSDILLRPFAAVGRRALDVAAWVGRWGSLMSEAGRQLSRPETWRPNLLGQMARIGVDSVPIALFISLFTGIVLALQASYTLTGAVPLYFVGALVSKTMMIELGPVLTGLAISGRVGANIAAQIGTMRVTEQVDALETLGYNPVGYLVVPRILAGAIMTPAVTYLAILIGILAGWATSLSLLDMTTPEFLRGVRLFFEPFDVQFAGIKAISFGFAVTSIGCFAGFRASGGADGVGKAATRAVVVSSMVILVLDAFWAAALL